MTGNQVVLTSENYKEIAQKTGMPESELFDLLVKALETNETVVLTVDMIH